MAKQATKPAVKKLAVKKPLAKTAEKSVKTTTALPKKSAPVVKKAAIAAPEKKMPEMKTLAKKTPVKKIPAKISMEKKSKPAVDTKTTVKPSPEERYRMVELAAYFIAEQHGFTGRSDEYWVAAEQQIAARLGL